jgi:type 1 glutamine amidotransferase
VNRVHPAALGLDDFEVTNETYGIFNYTDDCDVLLTTSSDCSMHTLAWPRTYKHSRVFCMQLGHDPTYWENPAFEKAVMNGVQ